MNQNSVLLNVIESITNLPITGQNLTPSSSPVFSNLTVTGNQVIGGSLTVGGTINLNDISCNTLTAASTISASGDITTSSGISAANDINTSSSIIAGGDITTANSINSTQVNNVDTVTSKFFHSLSDTTVDGSIQCKELHCDDVITADTAVNSTTIHATNLLISDNITQSSTLVVGTILGLAAVIPVNGVPMQMNAGLKLPGLTGVDTNTNILTVNSGTNNVERRSFASINPLNTKGDLMTYSTGPFAIRQPVSATNGAILSSDSTAASGLTWDTKEALSLYRLNITLPMITVASGGTGNSAAVTMATGETHTVLVVTCIRNSVTFAQGFVQATLRYKNVGGTVTLVGSANISSSTEGGVNGSSWTASASGATYFLAYTAGSVGNPVNFSSTLYITRCI